MQEQKKRGRPNNQQRQLNESLIIYMAKSLMREQGNIPSIRGVARALNVDAMAIYHYFDNKNSLLNALIISLMDNLYCPQKQLPWQDSLHLLAESYLTLLRNYNGLLQMLIAMPHAGPMMIFSDRFNKIITPLNFSPQKQKSTFLLLVHFLHGQSLLPDSEASREDQKNSFNDVLALYYKVIAV